MKNIILVGFMGTGKTTVGKILERKLNMKFVDTDNLIENREGIKISEIFEKKGEPYFRKIESEAVAMVSKESNQIIATGGGAIVNENNLKMLKESGKVIYLRTTPETIIKRVQNDGSRPLLKGKDIKVEIDKLLQIRTQYYNKADISIDTDDKTPEVVADEIISNVSTENVRVNLEDRSYNIKIGAGLLGSAGKEIRSLGYKGKVVVITDDKVDKLYSAKLLKSLADSGFTPEKIVVKDGEVSKSLKVADEVITRLLELKCERGTPLVALGGGVIGDLTGFVASIYLRGVPFIQIPTTLLAQVDSSVGGKTGVNHKLGKNLIGSFYQPQLVIIDIEVLKTLPKEELLNGLAEVIKYGVIKDATFFEYLKNNAHAIMEKDAEALKHIIKRSCEIKAEVVSADERESGLRVILNFGHTMGHAIEAVSDYETKHGAAVAMGMVFAGKFAVRKGLCDRFTFDDIFGILKEYRINSDIKIYMGKDIIDAMRLDKKVKNGNIKFVLPTKIGEVKHGVDVSENEINEVLSSWND